VNRAEAHPNSDAETAPDSRLRSASPDHGGAVFIREQHIHPELPLFGNPDWQARFPWLFHATSGAGSRRDFDLSFFGRSPAGNVFDRWRAIQEATGFSSVVHARQVHGAVVLDHLASPKGINIRDDADGHVTTRPGILLAVSIADCVPVFLVDQEQRGIALLHAGWRGVVAGILERGVEQLIRTSGAQPGDLYCYFGPAICGRCYEVGPEVHEALGLERPAANTPVDLRAVLGDRARRLGLSPDRISSSESCTRCGDGTFFSHRGGARERQMGLLGIRNAP
jgi:polyphenol oxidase